MKRRGHEPAVGERLGGGRHLPEAERRIWIHGASVGEILALEPLLKLLHESGVELLVSSMTSTGKVALLGGDVPVTHRYLPMDVPWAVGRALDRVHPSVLVLTESELWPSLVTTAARRIPVVVVNGRVSDSTAARGGRSLLRGYHRWLLSHLTYVGARSPEDARRFLALGLPPERVATLGNLKFDRELPSSQDEALSGLREQLGLDPSQRLVVGGSTFPGEEALLTRVHSRLRARHPDLRLLLAPRHPDRIPEVEAELARMGLPTLRRSVAGGLTPGAGEGPSSASEDPPILLLDTVGELAALYRLAHVAFVGRSLAEGGGQNPLEPLAQGVPVLFGPRMENFRDEAAGAQAAGGAWEVRSEAALEEALARLLDDPELREAMGGAGRRWTAQNRGAAGRYRDLLLDVGSR